MNVGNYKYVMTLLLTSALGRFT